MDQPITLSSEQIAALTEVLESERARLLVEIRHTRHRAYRDGLHHKLDLVDQVLDRCGAETAAAARE